MRMIGLKFWDPEIQELRKDKKRTSRRQLTASDQKIINKILVQFPDEEEASTTRMTSQVIKINMILNFQKGRFYF